MWMEENLRKSGLTESPVHFCGADTATFNSLHLASPTRLFNDTNLAQNCLETKRTMDVGTRSIAALRMHSFVA